MFQGDRRGPDERPARRVGDSLPDSDGGSEVAQGRLDRYAGPDLARLPAVVPHVE